MRFTIKAKLGFAFGLLIVMMGTSGLYAISSLGGANDRMQSFAKGPFAQVQRVDQLDRDAVEASRILESSMLVSTDAQRKQLGDEFDTNDATFRALLDAYVADLPVDKRDVADPLSRAWALLVDASHKLFADSLRNCNNHGSDAAELTVSPAEDLRERFVAIGDRPGATDQIRKLAATAVASLSRVQRDIYRSIVISDDHVIKQVDANFQGEMRDVADDVPVLAGVGGQGSSDLAVAWSGFEKLAREAEGFGLQNSDAHALNTYAGPFSEARKNVAAEAARLRGYEASIAHDFVAGTQSSYERTRTMLIAIILGALLLGAGMAFWIAFSISRGLGRAVGVARSVADGDLAREIAVSGRDEIGDLERAMKEMADKLRDIVGQVVSAASNVSASASQLSASAEQLSEGSTEQAASTEEASASVEEMSANVKQNAENASQTERIAEQSAQDAEKSGVAVSRAVDAMQTIAGKINIVQEIARQTDLLALNAAVEAARAGEHVQGFAVVASEVRKLAERSQAAAAEIGTLSADTLKVAQEAGTMLDRLVPDIKRTAKLVQGISTSSREQDVGTSQINQAIQQLDKVTQQNAASSEEVSATSEELASQAEQLQGTIAYFRTGAAPAPAPVQAGVAFDRTVKQLRASAVSGAAMVRQRPKRPAVRQGAPAGGFAFDLHDGDADANDAAFKRG